MLAVAQAIGERSYNDRAKRVGWVVTTIGPSGRR
jgi:hypothetical protein